MFVARFVVYTTIQHPKYIMEAKVNYICKTHSIRSHCIKGVHFGSHTQLIQSYIVDIMAFSLEYTSEHAHGKEYGIHNVANKSLSVCF